MCVKAYVILRQVLTLEVVALLKLLEEAELVLYKSLDLHVVRKIAALQCDQRLWLSSARYVVSLGVLNNKEISRGRTWFFSLEFPQQREQGRLAALAPQERRRRWWQRYWSCWCCAAMMAARRRRRPAQ